MRGGAAGGGLSGLAEAEVAAALARVQALAEAEPEREVCGFLVRRGAALEVWPARNAAADPRHAFEVAPADVLAALRRVEREGLALAAVYHSHPRGGTALSARDLAALAPGGAPLLEGVALVVVALRAGAVEGVAIHQWCESGFAARDVALARSGRG